MILILNLTLDFIQMLGCTQSLTLSRNNGFLNTLLKLMQRKALQLYMEVENPTDSNQIHDGKANNFHMIMFNTQVI
jgi:hypothetical protein